MQRGTTFALRWVLLICAAVALFAAAGGCGSGDDKNGSSTAAKPRTTAVDPVRQAKLMKTGKQVFFEKCHSCHTLLGRKHTAAIVETEAPDFDEVQLPDPEYIRSRIMSGGFDMQSFQGELSPFQIDAVIAYVGATAGRNVDDATADGRPPAQLAAGRQLFAERCARCHGIAGKPRLEKVQWPGTDFNVVKPSEAFAIRKTLEGLEGAMPSFKGRLTSVELHAVAAYVASVSTDSSDSGG